MDETTDWFDAAVRPWHLGVYERREPAGPYACWDGHRWRADARSAADAVRQSQPTCHADAPWRGLALRSAAPCETCRGHTLVDRGVDVATGRDLIDECPDC